MKLKEPKQINLQGRDKKIMKTKIKQEKGITLIALVVTIVVLLILAGVSVNALFGDSGIIEKAKEAQNKMDEAQQKDLNSINELNNWLENQVNGKTTGGDDNPSTTTTKISTLIGTVVDKNTKAEDAYGNKITIPKGFEVLAHSENTTTGDVTYSYSGDNIPAVQDGIVIENGTDGNQFVWVPVGTIKNKDGSTNTITLGRYSDFTATNGVYTPAQKAENYTQETTITIGENKNYTIAKLAIQNEKENSIKINKTIQFEGVEENIKIIETATPEPSAQENYKELTKFRAGNSATDSTAQNATARDLETFVETSLANGGYYIARFEASGTTSKITSKYNQTVLTNITQLNAAKVAREMYGDTTEYASDLVNSYAWDTAIIFIQTYGTGADASTYASKNKSTSFANTGINPDKYCNIFDMSGNAFEWTTEYSTYSVNSDFFYPYVTRGGYYGTASSQSSNYTSGRRNVEATHSCSSDSLRPILYVK